MRPRLPFVFIRSSSFVRDDLETLSDRFDVRPFEFGMSSGAVGKGVAVATGLVRLEAWLRSEMPRAAAAFGWFADYHTLPLARSGQRLGVPTVLSIGGYDAMDLPDLDYGVFGSRWRAPLARRALRTASVLAPVSGSLIRSQNAFLRPGEVVEQGVSRFAPSHAPAVAVPTGYDPDAWPLGMPDRPPAVLSVALIDSDRTLRRKGIDLLIEVARHLPDIPFSVIGLQVSEADVRAAYRPPPNVSFEPPVPREALAERYGRASVYLQLSRAEGMPNVLCEAMLCGAVPVGSAVFGIPDAIGDAGTVVHSPAPRQIAEAVQSALGADAENRRAARDHIAETFPRERRRRTLFRLLEGLMDGEAPAALAAEIGS